jgi:DNA repair exonuclease SbcCD nuclease subunit
MEACGMKILHTGDWHIGAQCDEDLSAAVKNIAEIARTTIRPDKIIIPGDIYDGSSTPENRNLACELICGLAEIAEVIIIKGNHDVSKDLIILGNLSAQHNILVYENPGTILNGGLAIHCLPHFTKAGWVAAGLGRNLGIEAGNNTVSMLALTYLRSMVMSTQSSKHLLYGHLTITGSKLENHQPLIGESITFGYHDLVEAGFVGGGFSHIHLAQVFGDRDNDSPEFRYAGSPVALNYGESAKNKSFCVFDTETLRFTVYPLKSVPRVTLEATWNGSLVWESNIAEAVPGARVRVKLMIEEGYVSADGENAVKAVLAPMSLLDWKIEKQRKPIDQVRAATIAAAKTAQDKLIAYWEATKTTPEEPMRSDMLRITGEIESECITGQ